MRKGDLANRLSSIPGATGGIARLAFDRLRAAGINLAPVISGAGLTPEDVEDRQRPLDATVQVRVLELAAKELQDDCFGFHLARGFELGEIGLLYYVMASSERLADAPRSGAPATYTPEQICAVIAMTCEKPSESERPISHWSQREIADEAIRRGLVSNISQRSVGRFLKKRPTLNRTAFVTG